jgi:hypothetical protein
LLTFYFVSNEDPDEWKQIICVIQTESPPVIPSNFEKRKKGTNFLDAILIRVAPER